MNESEYRQLKSLAHGMRDCPEKAVLRCLLGLVAEQDQAGLRELMDSAARLAQAYIDRIEQQRAGLRN